MITGPKQCILYRQHVRSNTENKRIVTRRQINGERTALLAVQGLLRGFFPGPKGEKTIIYQRSDSFPPRRQA